MAAAAATGRLPPVLPPIGIGTYELRGNACVDAVRAALMMGYRLIDTAAVYRNEELVGEGIASSGVPRAELFIVVKIAMKSMKADEAVRHGILDSLRKLRIDYADCVLMHWPGCGGLKPDNAAGHQAARARCWRVMQVLQQEGKVRHCGVSNFLPRHFEQLDSRPADRGGAMVNQVELHPLCVQRDVDAYCRGGRGMLLQQYSPLGKGDSRLLQHPRLLEVHARYFGGGGDDVGAPLAYSVPDLLLMWGLAQRYCTLVRSHRVEHLRANLYAARDYLRSVEAAAAAAAGEASDGGGSARALLTAEQLDVVRRLRHYMGVEEDPDTHFCWYSAEIA
ncbi:aldo/keto reductase [Novymonas esmeraldas]|uniref:Aldo/keto reductase n=1 Tax=Novymonas esmeraldas TaxID=1808958 RepID=A0AAW0EL89_9TRYP